MKVKIIYVKYKLIGNKKILNSLFEKFNFFENSNVLHQNLINLYKIDCYFITVTI